MSGSIHNIGAGFYPGAQSTGEGGFDPSTQASASIPQAQETTVTQASQMTATEGFQLSDIPWWGWALIAIIGVKILSGK